MFIMTRKEMQRRLIVEFLIFEIDAMIFCLYLKQKNERYPEAK